jgi:TatD DNase family protein
MYVDSHCHLNFPELASQLTDVRAAMAQAQVGRALCISTRLETFPDVHALAMKYDNFWCTVGVHPDEEYVQEPTVDKLVQLAQQDRVVGLGETGLDYFRLGTRSIADMEWQRERFRTHIRAARHVQKPLVVHTRQASDDTLSILKDEGAEAVGGVFHCFTETQAVARAALDLGFYVSFSGILTFKNASDLRAVAAETPLDRCLIETDSPYLAPMPHRGKINTPAWVPLVAKELARIKDVSVETVAKATTENFERLFRMHHFAN